MGRRHPKRHSKETKLLVLEFRQLFRSAYEDIPISNRSQNFANYMTRLGQITSIRLMKRALIKTPGLQNILKSKIQNGGILEYLVHQETEFVNFARILKFLNKMLNGIAKPSIICSGFWTKKYQIIEQNQCLNQQAQDTQDKRSSFHNLSQPENVDVNWAFDEDFGLNLDRIQNQDDFNGHNLLDELAQEHLDFRSKERLFPTGDGEDSDNAQL